MSTALFSTFRPILESGDESAALRFLEQHGTEIDFLPSESTIILNRVISLGFYSLLEALIKLPFPPDVLNGSHCIEPPLHLAVKQGRMDIAACLVKAGAKPNVLNQDGENAIHMMVNRYLKVALLETEDKDELFATQGDDAFFATYQEHRYEQYFSCISTLVRLGTDPNQIASSNNRSSLHQAALAGDAKLIRVLYACGARLLLTDEVGRTALHYAVHSVKNVKTVIKTLVRLGATLDARDVGRFTPLHMSIKYGNTDAAEALVELGASLDLQCNFLEPRNEIDLNGYCLLGSLRNLMPQFMELGFALTPLSLAALEGRVEIIRILCAHPDISPNSIERGMGFSPLHYAAFTGQVDAVRVLIELGASIEAPSHATEIFAQGLTPLHAVACSMLYDPNIAAEFSAINNSNSQALVTKMLLRFGANINARDANGCSALHWAVRNGYSTLAHMLVHAGADVHARTQDGWTPLHFACEKGDLESIMFLLQNNADHLAEATGEAAAIITPLSLTQRIDSPIRPFALGRCFRKARLLPVRQSEMDRYSTFLWQRAALVVSIHTPTSEKKKLPLMLQVTLEMQRLLASHTEDLDEKSLIHDAAQAGDALKIRALVELWKTGLFVVWKIDNAPNLRLPDGSTPLHIAVIHGHEEAVKALLELGADPNLTNVDGQCAMHFAVGGGYINIVQILINAGADSALVIPSPDGKKVTAREVAAIIERTDIVAVLDAASARPRPSIDTRGTRAHKFEMHFWAKNAQLSQAQTTPHSGSSSQYLSISSPKGLGV